MMMAAEETLDFAVAITTHNRRHTFNECLHNIQAHTPAEIPIIVVDDGSDAPLDLAPRGRSRRNITLHRNPIPTGIARAKNKCLELLMNTSAEHFFLFDDDCWPIDDWWKPYIDAAIKLGQHHFQLIHENHNDKCRLLRTDPDGIITWTWATACLMYVSRHAVKTVGGMRPEFGRCFGEHGEWSRRIHSAGLCRYEAQDVKGAAANLYSLDEYRRGINSVPEWIRRPLYKPNMQLEQYYSGNVDFVEYRERTPADVTVCIPWRATPGRQAAHDHAVKHWRDHGFTVIESDSDPDRPFLCAQARNNAIRQADTDVVIVADADMIVDDMDQILAAIQHSDGVTWPFTMFHHIDGGWAGRIDFRDAPIRQTYADSPGGIYVLKKKTWAFLGGFDEHFVPGCWGYDDTAFALAAETLSRIHRIPGIAYSFDHPVETVSESGEILPGRHMQNNANRIRYLRYWRAHQRRGVNAMRDLTGSPLCDSTVSV